MIADTDGWVSTHYGMIHPQSDPYATVRSVFVVDPAKKIRLILTYPPSTGRNFAELLRAIDSLQLTDRRSIATPVNWEPGDPVVISPKLSDEEAARLFPQGFKTLKPYLRVVELEGERAQ
jgi:alkyl hydroperoxide reductase subunit AhpC